VLEPYPADQICDGAHGTPLIPWPNRLADGSYSFEDEDFQVPLTEPAQGNAIHGFMMWRPWEAIEHEADRVSMVAGLHPMPGYPFDLSLQIDYGLSDTGLTVSTTATNTGERTAPYGHGQHPYLSPGDAVIDNCTLQLAGRTRVTTDSRQLPLSHEPVEGTEFDFTEPRIIGEIEIDFAFGSLIRDESGKAWTRLTGPDDATAELWVDESYEFVQTYTGDTLSAARARRGLGTEPMSCAPDAFNNGDGLVQLEPGQSVRNTWGARLG
jgi:aldose 1-epimerase